MNSNRYFQRLLQSEQKNVPRVYQCSFKDLTSISSQVVEDISQSSCSQQFSQFNEDSIFTFNQSQKKRNLLYAANTYVVRSAENSQNDNQQNIQLNKTNNQQQLFCVYDTSSNNQPNLTNKIEISDDSNQKNQYKRSQSLKYQTENFYQQFSNTFLSQQTNLSFSNTVQNNITSPMRNIQSSSQDSKVSGNRVITRSKAMQQSQNKQKINSSIGKQKKNGTNSRTNSSIKRKSLYLNNIQANYQKPSTKIIIGQIAQQSQSFGNNKIEATKYKKNKKNDSNFYDENQSNQSGSTGAKTQPKLRKEDINQPNFDNGSLDYYSTTAKQIKDNKTNHKNFLFFGEDINNCLYNDSKNINIISNSNNKMNNTNPIFLPGYSKIVKKSDVINKQQGIDIFSSSSHPPSNGGRKTDSALTSVTQCKNFSNKSNNESKNIFKRINSIKKPFFLYDEEDDDYQDLSIGNSLQTSDETFLNIDETNFWNNGGRNKYVKQEEKQTSINNNNQKNIQNKIEIINLEDDIDFNSIFQKKTKNTLQKSQYIGADNAFTVNYEKLRYSSTNSYRLRHFEFNCFKDKDLNVHEQHQNKLQEIAIDDDVQTDDETLDHYIQVCFDDLIIGIDMQILYSFSFLLF